MVWQGYEAVLDVPVDGLRGKSYQWWVSQLPVRLGGLGIRCQSSLSSAAFLGTVELCVPSFAGPQGICTNLAHLVGEEGMEVNRWAPLLASGSRLGAEVARAWEATKAEAQQSCAFLEKDLPEVFSPEAEGFGQGSSGETRQRIIEARESLLAGLVEKGLSLHADQSSMAVKGWRNRDKLSTAFLLELPGPHNQWSSAEWGEALCLVLSLPPNCCRDPQKLGQPIGNRQVDLWGADVLCATLPGGSWTRQGEVRHQLPGSLLWRDLRLRALCSVLCPPTSAPPAPTPRTSGSTGAQT